VAGDIQTLQFTYFDTSGLVIPVPVQPQRLRDIFAVQVRIRARTPGYWSTNVDTLRRELREMVQIRSRQGR
jgi:hypothetical protein